MSPFNGFQINSTLSALANQRSSCKNHFDYKIRVFVGGKFQFYSSIKLYLWSYLLFDTMLKSNGPLKNILYMLVELHHIQIITNSYLFVRFLCFLIIVFDFEQFKQPLVSLMTCAHKFYHEFNQKCAAVIASLLEYEI